jgi:hypothetical protein
MAQEKPNRLAEWLLIARSNYPLLRRRLAAWAEAVREEPGLIWQTRASRYTIYSIGLLILLWGTSTVSNSLAGAAPESIPDRATTGDFHAVCSRAACEHHFVVHREFGFDDFPVKCSKCGQETGMAARRCTSQECNGRWTAPEAHGGNLLCPYCGQSFGP